MAEKIMPDDKHNASSNTQASQDTASSRRRTRARYNTPPSKMNAKTEVELVEESFAALTEHGEQLVAHFYERLLSQHKELIPVFNGVPMGGQQKKFFASLVLIVQSLRQPEVLEDYLRGLGARHQHYGVKAEYYTAIVNNLLAVMAELSGDAWTQEVNEAWSNTLNRVITIMKAASCSEIEELPQQKGSEAQAHHVDAEAELAQFKAAMNNVRTPIMIIDRELIINYVNVATEELLTTHESALMDRYPTLSISHLVGSNICAFHPNPETLRQFLSSLTNLPHRFDIDIDGLSLQLNVTALLDGAGHYIGNVLEWTNITATKYRDDMYDAQCAALNNVMNVATLDLNGIIVEANDNFLQMMGYERETLLGQSHQQLLPKTLQQSELETAFWRDLHQGHAESGEFKRIKQNGEEIWWQGAYTPVLDNEGEPVNIMIYVTDITESKIRNADIEEQLNAIDKVMSVISYDMDGNILSANQNFLDVVGYQKEDVIGRHHSMFVEPEYAASHEYQTFWNNLRQGHHEQGQFKRLRGEGQEAWLQASYNPIFDLNGKPVKVVRYATDITDQKVLQQEVENLLDETSSVMMAMSEGDLTKTIAGEYEGHFALLQNAVNDTVGKIAEIAKEIGQASKCISTSATDIAKETTDLGSRTEQQSHALSEVARSIDMMTTAVRQNGDNAQQASLLANQAREQAEKGAAAMEQANGAMLAVSQVNQQIAQIINVVDDIAFQTNLLALNASVEAAKAGEKGRGFAIIAAEVRQLAQRASSTIKDMKLLMGDSVSQAKEGMHSVNASGQVIEEIVLGAQRVGDIVSKMASAGSEQAQGLTQVNDAMIKVNEMTQHNAELVEKAASTSQLLNEKGQSLAQLIDSFQIEQEES